MIDECDASLYVESIVRVTVLAGLERRRPKVPIPLKAMPPCCPWPCRCRERQGARAVASERAWRAVPHLCARGHMHLSSTRGRAEPRRGPVREEGGLAGSRRSLVLHLVAKRFRLLLLCHVRVVRA